MICKQCNLEKNEEDFYKNKNKDTYKKRSYCKDCCKNNLKELKIKRKELRICGRCSSPDLVSAGMCSKCYFKKISQKTFGTPIYYQNIIDLWIKQDKKCAISGRVIIPNKNLSVDHILPKSTHPHLAKDINNIQLLDFHVNKCKSSLNEEEFKSLITDIYNNYVAKIKDNI